MSLKRATKAAHRFFTTSIRSHGVPTVVTTDRSAALARAIIELVPAGAHHDTTQYANNRIEAHHGRLKARLRPMRGLKRDRTVSVVIRGHAFIQNLRRGHYELGVDPPPGPHSCHSVRRTGRSNLNPTPRLPPANHPSPRSIKETAPLRFDHVPPRSDDHSDITCRHRFCTRSRVASEMGFDDQPASRNPVTSGPTFSNASH